MKEEKKAETFSKLGENLNRIANSIEDSTYTEKIKEAIANNRWFTIDSIKGSLLAISESLQASKIQQWFSAYNFNNNTGGKSIGLVLAGNLPLVGFHDILCCLVTNNKVVAKLSSKDQVLYDIIKTELVSIDTSYESKIVFTDQLLKDIDAIIATGSNNSARYFEYYFGKYPNIIRKNRNSIAILSGNENIEEFEALGNDIFTYYGLGCRNVSQIWVPENYNFDAFFKGIECFNGITNQTKYANNYDYQKAILLMNQVPIFDNGFILLKQDQSLNSPIGVIHYQYYKSEKQIEDFMLANKHKIQCTVSKTNWSFKTYGLGMAQQPELWDYADNVDTIEFLLKLK